MDITTIITAILTFIGGGGIAAIILLPQRKKTVELENEAKASEQWKELFERSEKDNAAQSALIDKLYDDLKASRDENNRLTTEVAVLRIWKCEKIECITREPPFGSVNSNKI